MKYVVCFLAVWAVIGFLNAIGPGMFSQDKAIAQTVVKWNAIASFVEALKLYGVAILAVRTLK